VAVEPDARNWYIELWSADRAYRVELGLRQGGRFEPIGRPSFVELPPAGPRSLVGPEPEPARAAPRPPPVADAVATSASASAPPPTGGPAPALPAVSASAPAPALAPPEAPLLGLADEYAAWLRAERERERAARRAEEQAADPAARRTELDEHGARADSGSASVDSPGSPALATHPLLPSDGEPGAPHGFADGLGSMRAPGGSFFEGLGSMRAPDRSG
jgi:hypothetical protein